MWKKDSGPGEFPIYVIDIVNEQTLFLPTEIMKLFIIAATPSMFLLTAF